MAVFWDATQCSVIDIERRFRGTCFIIISLMTEAVTSPKRPPFCTRSDGSAVHKAASHLQSRVGQHTEVLRTE